MAFDHFGDLFELGHHVAIHGAALEVDADIGAGGIAEHLWIDVIARSGDDFEVDEALYALMDCRARHSALHGYVF